MAKFQTKTSSFQYRTQFHSKLPAWFFDQDLSVVFCPDTFFRETLYLVYKDSAQLRPFTSTKTRNIDAAPVKGKKAVSLNFFHDHGKILAWLAWSCTIMANLINPKHSEDTWNQVFCFLECNSGNLDPQIVSQFWCSAAFLSLLSFHLLVLCKKQPNFAVKAFVKS